MARRKRSKEEKPDEAQQLPMSFQEAKATELRLFPHELRPGDLVNVHGVDWQASSHPAVYRMGKMVEVRLHKPGDPSLTSAEHWGSA
jgi:hypothetical protein